MGGEESEADMGGVLLHEAPPKAGLVDCGVVSVSGEDAAAYKQMVTVTLGGERCR